MKKFSQFVVKARYAILIIAVLLLIPSAIGYFNTRVNYDLLYYLPDGIDTMTGQDIMMDEFNSGAFSIVMVDKMDDKDRIMELEHLKLDGACWQRKINLSIALLVAEGFLCKIDIDFALFLHI